VALPQSPLGELTALSDPLSGLRGPTSKGRRGDGKGRGGEGRRGEGERSLGEGRGRDQTPSRLSQSIFLDTPLFSVDSKLLRYFPGHADAFQILLYGVYPVLSWSSTLSFCTAYIPVLAVCCRPFAEHALAISVFSLL